MEQRGVCRLGGVFVCKFVEMSFSTYQSVRVSVGGRISGVSVRQGSTIYDVHNVCTSCGGQYTWYTLRWLIFAGSNIADWPKYAQFCTHNIC